MYIKFFLQSKRQGVSSLPYADLPDAAEHTEEFCHQGLCRVGGVAVSVLYAVELAGAYLEAIACGVFVKALIGKGKLRGDIAEIIVGVGADQGQLEGAALLDLYAALGEHFIGCGDEGHIAEGNGVQLQYSGAGLFQVSAHILIGAGGLHRAAFHGGILDA